MIPWVAILIAIAIAASVALAASFVYFVWALIHTLEDHDD